MVSENGNTNRNASRCCNGDLVVSNACKAHQRNAGILKNRNIAGMRFHDCKYGLLVREELGEYLVYSGVRVGAVGVRG